MVDHFVENENENEFILTPEDPVAVAVEKGLITKKSDMKNTHEEANVIIVNQLAYAVKRGSSNILNAMILMCLYLCLSTAKKNWLCSDNAESSSRTVSHIHHGISNMTQSILQNLPAMHALSGSDTTSYLFGIRKATAIKVQAKGQRLNLLWEGAVTDNYC